MFGLCFLDTLDLGIWDKCTVFFGGSKSYAMEDTRQREPVSMAIRAADELLAERADPVPRMAAGFRRIVGDACDILDTNVRTNSN